MSLRSRATGVEQLDMTPTARLSCRLHPSTGRLSCTYITSGRRPPGGTATTVGAPERSRVEAARRARRIVTELIHDHGLTYLWTLTFKVEPHDHRAVLADLSGFTRRLRDAGRRTPRLTVPELSSRWHLHMAVPTVESLVIMSELWEHGQVRGPDMAQASAPGALMGLSRYLTKGFESTDKGCRRYIASAGLRPVEERFTAPDAATALARASARMSVREQHSDWYSGNFMAFFPASSTVGST